MKQLNLVSFAFMILLCSCTLPQHTTTTATQRIPATFDYSPPSRVQPGATGMAIALIRPSYIAKDAEYLAPPFSEMASGMANDFEEMLTAKGFSIKGPFASRDEMVYNDKVTSDFAIEVSIDLRPQYNRKYTPVTNWGSVLDHSANQNFYKMNGEVTFSGDLIITAASPQYGEKLWKKKIALAPQSFTYTGTTKWTGVPTMADELRQDNTVYNTVARELEKFYTGALNLCWQQIDPVEMKTISAQAKRADRK